MVHSKTIHRLIAARTRLVFDQPFFGALALRLRIVEDPTCPTGWTDGTRMGVNPVWLATINDDEVMAFVAHEVMHCSNGHMWRRDARHPFKWNVAADGAINPVLRAARFKLPGGAIMVDEWAGKSAEWIYARLPEVQTMTGSGGKGKKGGKGDQYGGGGRGPTTDDVRDPESGGASESSEAEWREAVHAAAAAAKMQGKLPAELARFVTSAVKPRVDWRAELRRFVQMATAREDYSWSRPSSRYVAHRIYLPQLRSEEVGPLAAIIDTSGSVDGPLLNQFVAELNAILQEVKPARLDVYSCDAAVHSHDEHFPGDTVETANIKGGGGTDFRPAFDAIGQLDTPPLAAIYLTDLYGSFPAEAPPYPVLWAVPDGSSAAEPPFGTVIHCDGA